MTESAKPNNRLPPTDQPSASAADQRRRRQLANRSRHGDPPHREEIAPGETEPDAEHEKDDADLGKLGDQGLIRDEARRVRADQHAREQVAHQRRQTQPVGGGAKHQGQKQAGNECRDEVRGVRHRRDLTQAVALFTIGAP